MIDAKTLARKLFLGGAHWSGAAALAQPFLANSGAILMLHRVSAKNTSPLGFSSHLAITPRFLDALLSDLRRRGYALLSLDELLEALAANRAARAVAITADDGWLDNLTEALTVFEAHDAPFTVYVAPGLTNGEVAPWWEVVEEFVAARDIVRLPATHGGVELPCDTPDRKRKAVHSLAKWLTQEVSEEDQQNTLRLIGAVSAQDRRFMNWDEVCALSAHRLATIGAHTVNHYSLARLSADAALREMLDSADIIERETGSRPAHFAYPYGSRSAACQREFDLAREAGFASAVTTRHGVLRSADIHHLHALPRISVNGLYQRLPYMSTLLSGLTTVRS